MTNPERARRSGVAGPVLAALSALVLLTGVGWFVLRDTGDDKPVVQQQPVTSTTTPDDDDPTTVSPTPVRPTSPSVTTRRTATPTPTKAVSKTPTPTRSSTAPSREGTRKPTTSPSHTATPKASTPTKTATTTASGGSPEAQVLALTNAERKKAGCGALRYNSALTKAAEAHAADMVAKHYFAHDSQDGRSPFDRMKAAGFKGGSMAENIAVGYTSPAAVVKGWMNSPGHRANILNCGYTMLGVGYNSGQVKPEWGKGSWVQDFGG